MKMKFITAIVAFFIPFTLCVLLIGVPKENFEPSRFGLQSGNQTQQNISSLISRDIRNGRERDCKAKKLYDSGESENSIYASAEYAEIIDDYVSASESIDDTNVPPDFRSAWHNHMKIWREHADFLNQEKEFSAWRKTDDNETLQTISDQEREIEDTWREVILTGRKYNVFIAFYN
jgi:hypothetical protein